jgi:NAD(P) transhydrogenase
LEPDVTAAVFEQEENRILGQPIPYDELTIGVMKETFKGENRVSQTPDSIKMLIKEGFNVVVQAGGKNSFGCDRCLSETSQLT